MKSKRRIINMLRNPDEKTLEKLSSEYPQAEPNHKNKMYEKVKERMNSNDNAFTDEVRGVEKYTRRHLWKRIPAAVMSIALVGGAIGGGVIMLKNNSRTMPSTEIAEETTTLNDVETTVNSVIDGTNAEQKIDQSDVTKDLIFAICENGMTKNFDKISYSYKSRSDYDTGYHDEENTEISVDNTQNTATRTSIGGYYRDDGSIVHDTNYTQYFYHNTVAGIGESESNEIGGNKKEFFTLENDDLNYLINDASSDGKNLLENFDNWNITGFEEYLGRKCAVISGTSDIKIQYESSPDDDEEESFDICTCEFTILIDYETGIWMKSDIKHTNYDLEHYTVTITDIAFEDDAKPPMSKDEFKQLALNDCVKRVCDENGQNCTFEAVNESDLAFLE
ncbi:hypothetical protein [Ruminococcus sp.]|jgi:hypothetical protein|uniref:hypothetical protein n=1 Tax=Ruminococcus sp. TaxID=41978 RepID=UPI0025D6A264|nr:hypothetical protein [Ruminococcus sp.]